MLGAPERDGGVGACWRGRGEGDVAEDFGQRIRCRRRRRRGDFSLFCYPCFERGGRCEEFDCVRDALDWVAVAGVDAGEEGGAGREVGGVADTDGGGGGGCCWHVYELLF